MKAYCTKAYLSIMDVDFDAPTIVYVFYTEQEAIDYVDKVNDRKILIARYVGERDLLEIIRSNKRCTVKSGVR